MYHITYSFDRLLTAYCGCLVADCDDDDNAFYVDCRCLLMWWRHGAVVKRQTCNQEVVGSSLGRTRGLKTLGKFLTPMCLCHQAVQVGTGLKVVMSDGWEANCVPSRK